MNCSYKQGRKVIRSVEAIITTLYFQNTSALMKQGDNNYADKKQIYLQHACFTKNLNILQILMLMQDIISCISIPFSSICTFVVILEELIIQFNQCQQYDSF